jgi:hypothetical protein
MSGTPPCPDCGSPGVTYPAHREVGPAHTVWACGNFEWEGSGHEGATPYGDGLPTTCELIAGLQRRYGDAVIDYAEACRERDEFRSEVERLRRIGTAND